MSVYMYVCMYVCMCVCVCMYVHVCVCVCVCKCVFADVMSLLLFTYTLGALYEKCNKEHEEAGHVEQEQPHQFILQGRARMMPFKVSSHLEEEREKDVPPEDHQLDLQQVDPAQQTSTKNYP